MGDARRSGCHATTIRDSRAPMWTSGHGRVAIRGLSSGATGATMPRSGSQLPAPDLADRASIPPGANAARPLHSVSTPVSGGASVLAFPLSITETITAPDDSQRRRSRPRKATNAMPLRARRTDAHAPGDREAVRQAQGGFRSGGGGADGVKVRVTRGAIHAATSQTPDAHWKPRPAHQSETTHDGDEIDHPAGHPVGGPDHVVGCSSEERPPRHPPPPASPRRPRLRLRFIAGGGPKDTRT